MRKRLIIELSEEDLRSVMGAVLKTGADFRVETLEEAGESRAPSRSIQRKTPDGKTASDIVLDFVANAKRNVHISELTALSKSSGFNENTIKAHVRKLCESGVLIADGNHVRAA